LSLTSINLRLRCDPIYLAGSRNMCRHDPLVRPISRLAREGSEIHADVGLDVTDQDAIMQRFKAFHGAASFERCSLNASTKNMRRSHAIGLIIKESPPNVMPRRKFAPH
jgi:hypothetical protein